MTTREGLVLAADLFGGGMVSTFGRLEAAQGDRPAPAGAGQAKEALEAVDGVQLCVAFYKTFHLDDTAAGFDEQGLPRAYGLPLM